MPVLSKTIKLSESHVIHISGKPHRVTVSIRPVDSIDVGLYANAEAYLGSKADEYVKAIRACSEVAWPGISPKVADSDGSDYYSYYDSKRDVEYELSGLRAGIKVIGYPQADMANYDFNKRRMQSYLFDLLNTPRMEATHGQKR